MKRGDKVEISFKGKLEQKPVVLSDGNTFLRVRVGGKPGWIAIVPTDSAKLIEDASDYANGHTYDRT